MHQVIHNTNDRRTEYSYSCLQPAQGPPFWSNDAFWASKICVFSMLVTEKINKGYLILNIGYPNFVMFQNLSMIYQWHWIWIHKCFCSILYFVITYYRVSHIEMFLLNGLWQIELCKLYFAWRYLCISEVMAFEFHTPVFKKVSIGWPQQPPIETVPYISESSDFWWTIPQKMSNTGHFDAINDQTIGIRIFLRK